MNFTDYTDYTLKAISSVDVAEVERLTDSLFEAFELGNTVFVIGNGGSAANASHFAQDLAKGTLAHADQEKRLKALSLTDNLPFISALGNDEGYENVFVQQLRTFASAGDLLVAISGSGNSPNILKAIEFAKGKGMKTIGITGFDGGKLRGIADEGVHVPLNDMCTSESVHSVIFHYVILELKDRIASDQ
ncbi:MAG: SIS domain-containing protein [Ignavibacteriae bacterium]|nr:SIS domain-containing protein [Ignavibacteriota bacterium]MCB9216098.1 SIS domain-containing protein [Ignavibacteria bacterium]